MTKLPAISISHLSPGIEGMYVMAALSRIWERKGFRVEIGPGYDPGASICVLHHDRTLLDRALLPSAPPGVRPINGEVLDISKRAISTLRLSPDTPWPGQVIVKTNLNHYGVPESQGVRDNATRRLRKRLARYSWRAARMLPERYYPVLNSLQGVPDWVWSDPAYIVEKFLPERTEDGLYSVRGWMFFGNRGDAYRVISSHPLVKAGTMVRHEPVEQIPKELIALRERLKFDYGKFDYVEHDGKPILLDANKTPTYSGSSESPKLHALAEGIEAFL